MSSASVPELRVAVTTANFLPWTALSLSAIRKVLAFANAEGFAPTEVLVTRAVCRALAQAHDTRPSQILGGPIGSSHEVWNPADSLLNQVCRILKRKPQSRGMIPYPMDCIFFANQVVSEAAAFRIAESENCVMVVSQLTSPVDGKPYRSKAAAVQVHPDMGPDGTYMSLEEVCNVIRQQNYGVVLDVNHACRRVRLHRNGVTEIFPPLAGPGDLSSGGVRKVWEKLGDRICLVHFQFTSPGQLLESLTKKRLSESFSEFREILPEIARREIRIVIEISPPRAAAAMRDMGSRFPYALAKYGLFLEPLKEITLRIRDLLVRQAAES